MTRKIIPKKEFCPCDKKVTDHHFFCNKCWSKREDMKKRIDKYKFCKKHSRSKRGKKVLDQKIKNLNEKLKIISRPKKKNK